MMFYEAALTRARICRVARDAGCGSRHGDRVSILRLRGDRAHGAGVARARGLDVRTPVRARRPGESSPSGIERMVGTEFDAHKESKLASVGVDDASYGPLSLKAMSYPRSTQFTELLVCFLRGSRGRLARGSIVCSHP